LLYHYPYKTATIGCGYEGVNYKLTPAIERGVDNSNRSVNYKLTPAGFDNSNREGF
jgi:hypothetical protein